MPAQVESLCERENDTYAQMVGPEADQGFTTIWKTPLRLNSIHLLWHTLRRILACDSTIRRPPLRRHRWAGHHLSHRFIIARWGLIVRRRRLKTTLGTTDAWRHCSPSRRLPRSELWRIQRIVSRRQYGSRLRSRSMGARGGPWPGGLCLRGWLDGRLLLAACHGSLGEAFGGRQAREDLHVAEMQREEDRLCQGWDGVLPLAFVLLNAEGGGLRGQRGGLVWDSCRRARWLAPADAEFELECVRPLEIARYEAGHDGVGERFVVPQDFVDLCFGAYRIVGFAL